MDFYIKDDKGTLIKLTGLVKIGNKTINSKFISEPEANQISAYRKYETGHSIPTGKTVLSTEWTLSGNTWMENLQFTDKILSKEDYDRALEHLILQERIERGYTTREPSMYINSSNPRWKSDAQDWVKHIDEVMEYSLSIMNDVEDGKQAPSIEDFISSVPKIKWMIN